MDNITANVNVPSPSALALPKGGGAVQGMGEVLSPPGSQGIAQLNIPLPISPGRGYAPDLSLYYSNSEGNGLFGQGFNVSVMRVVRQTRYGVPRYTADDVFVGPGGEELVAERDRSGKIVSRQCSSYGELALAGNYNVVRYLPRVEGAFHRIEHWALPDDAGFWLIHDASGDLHCLGKAPDARLADPHNAQHIAEWWLQESLSPAGHKIRYQYRQDCPSTALDRACYGNQVAADQLSAWNNLPIDQEKWLFTLLFDYGERGTDVNTAPGWEAKSAKVAARPDRPTSYKYGFAQEINLLCRQVLMFHCVKELNQGAPLLITRLLLEYAQDPLLTQLVSVCTLGYDSKGKAVSMPPLDMQYTPFSADLSAQNWQPLEALDKIKDGQNYQLVDLYGEGLPGLLYYDTRGWYYRSPERGDTPDSIRYGAIHQLPITPAFKRSELALMDLNGDGKLDWIIQRPGMAGYFTLKDDNQWSNFIPFNDWPSEFMAPKAQLADLLGAGLQDLVLIGPKSVRLYINTREGFAAPETQLQEPDITLPVQGRDITEMVAFSDMLGSGQQHLISVRHDSVTCWPNLGSGRFGAPRVLPGLTLDSQSFNPAQIYLADIDGSGAVDIIYAETERLLIFRNQSGQRFSAPLSLPLPSGVRYDRLCQLNCISLDGNGTTSIVLTVPYKAERHWCYTFADQKPYLISGYNNNMGTDMQFYYRSSAQYWLDEKQQQPQAPCHLPFSVQLLHGTEVRDEVTGNLLRQKFNYRHGVYDGELREFRGFGLVETQDTDENARGTGASDSFSDASLTRTWYHTGGKNDDLMPPDLPAVWMPYRLNRTRLTTLQNQDELNYEFSNGERRLEQRMHRALQGSVLRQEIYGLDKSKHQATPYSVILSRYQVRIVQPASDSSEPVVLPLAAETLNYYFERVAEDPRITQQIQLQYDACGIPLHSVSLVYPRRALSEVATCYPDVLPDGGVDASYDEQQTQLIINENRQQVHHLTQPHAWRIGLPDVVRQNVLQLTAAQIPRGGFSQEGLLHSAGVLKADAPRVYVGQTRYAYATTTPALVALLDYSENAIFDQPSLKAFDGVLSPEQVTETLKTAGYLQTDKLLGPDAETDQIWVARTGFTTWHDLKGFYLPAATRPNLLVGATELTWDPWFCAVIKVTDAAKLVTRAEYDYRVMSPWKIIDINDNSSEVLFDALGRAVATSFYGSEEGQEVGFSPVSAFSWPEKTLSQSLDAPAAKQIVATYVLTELFSWMGRLDRASFNPEEWHRLIEQRLITPDGYLRKAARVRAASERRDAIMTQQLAEKIIASERIPVFEAIFLADQYPDKPQQIRISMTSYDGFFRPLQSAQRHAPGEAYVRDAQGKLKSTQGKLDTAETTTRWAVSGRVEYNNKGQPVRAYQPYFVDNWRYVTDESLYQHGYADTHFYDPLGRETEVLTAKGYVRREGYYPWFTVSEDENDTLV